MCSVYGHLHIPRTTWYDDVRFEEVSVGYPREWRRRKPHGWLRPGLPDPPYAPGDPNAFGGPFELPPPMRPPGPRGASRPAARTHGGLLPIPPYPKATWGRGRVPGGGRPLGGGGGGGVPVISPPPQLFR